MYRDSIAQAAANLQIYLDNAGYIDANAAAEITGILNKITHLSLSYRLKLYFQPSSYRLHRSLRKIARSFEKVRAQHNAEYVDCELRDKQDFFSNIEGYTLDSQQARAIIIDECSNLVIAGAGSGKTTTIIGKIKYLVEHNNVSPHSILPISFTKKSAQSLQDRINIQGIEPKTFHALGYSIVKQVEGKDLNVLPADVYHIEGMFVGILAELMANPNYASLIADFFIKHLKQQKTAFEFKDFGEYAQYLNDQDIASYKQVAIRAGGKETFRNEQVKSVEECMIANFLLFNRVDYEYEAKYPFSTDKLYRPDFTITANGQKFYLEHFGINRQGQVPSFFAQNGQTPQQASDKYISDMLHKRRLHQANSTRLLETYSYQMTEGTLLEDLKLQLQAAGIILNPMTPTEMLEIIKQSSNREMDGFIELLQTFTSLFKLSGKKISDLKRDSRQRYATTPSERDRAIAFLEIFSLVLDRYEQAMASRGQIDFSDMLARATDYIQNGDFVCPWQYVIVDEFQDMSMGTYKLLKAMRQQNPNLKLFCVGDDWQSIYRFAGSDLGLFTEFETYFGPTARSYIENTYRFGEPLITFSGEFITRNPSQIKKQLHSPSGQSTQMWVHQALPKNSTAEVLVKTLQILEQYSGLKDSNSVMLIGRYRNDFNSISNISGQIKVNRHRKSVTYTLSHPGQIGQTIDIDFLTAHRAKGLEADFVIVLNCHGGTMGFPCLRADDPIINLLLSSADQFENAEERRLFYVAITRARKETVLLTDTTRRSRFILELSNHQSDPNTSYCPRCKRGILEVRNTTLNGHPRQFIGCSNYRYGCTYTSEIDIEMLV